MGTKLKHSWLPTVTGCSLAPTVVPWPQRSASSRGSSSCSDGDNGDDHYCDDDDNSTTWQCNGSMPEIPSDQYRWYTSILSLPCNP